MALGQYLYGGAPKIVQNAYAQQYQPPRISSPYVNSPGGNPGNYMAGVSSYFNPATQQPKAPAQQTAKPPAGAQQPPAGAPPGATSNIDYSSDPLLQQALGITGRQRTDLSGNLANAQYQALLGFGSKEAAAAVLGQNDPRLDAIGNNPFSTLGQLSQGFKFSQAEIQNQLAAAGADYGLAQQRSSTLGADEQAQLAAQLQTLATNRGQLGENQAADLSQINFNQGLQTDALNENLNKANLWYSSDRQKELANLMTQFGFQKDAANRTYSQGIADIGNQENSARVGSRTNLDQLSLALQAAQNNYNQANASGNLTLSEDAWQNALNTYNAGQGLDQQLSGLGQDYRNNLFGLDQQDLGYNTDAFNRAVAAVSAGGVGGAPAAPSGASPTSNLVPPSPDDYRMQLIGGAMRSGTRSAG